MLVTQQFTGRLLQDWLDAMRSGEVVQAHGCKVRRFGDGTEAYCALGLLQAKGRFNDDSARDYYSEPFEELLVQLNDAERLTFEEIADAMEGILTPIIARHSAKH